MIKTEKRINFLGCVVEDIKTKVQGIVVSVCFDIFGDAQAQVHRRPTNSASSFESQWQDITGCAVEKFKRELTIGGASFESQWYDIKRLKIVNNKKFKLAPDFNALETGSAKKTRFGKP